MDRQNAYLQKLKEMDDELNNNHEIHLDSSVPEELIENPITSGIPVELFKTATNFTRDEFEVLFSYFDVEIAKLTNSRGPKTKLSGMDRFFLLITYLKSYPSFTRLALDFGFSASYIQKVIETMILNLSKKFSDLFIIFLSKEQQIIDGIVFPEFPEVAIVLDCSVQEVPRFAGGFSELKVFYSNKHKKYCVKKEFAHMPDGRVCFVSKYYPGSKHDFALFRLNVEVYKSILQKPNLPNTYWKIMADKGYEGANQYIPSILPKKGKNLSSQETRENIKIGSSRIICEKF